MDRHNEHVDASKKTIWRWLLPILILVAGAGIAVGLVLSRKPPQRTDISSLGQLVETEVAQADSGFLTVEGFGTVTPTRTLSLVPRVAGYVATEALEPGKAFEKGAVLFTIDSEDYRLVEIKALSQVRQAESQLAEVRSKAASAKLEWERLPGREGLEPSDLLLFKPQVAAAEAALNAAKADLAARRLDVARCTLKAPFNCRVISESVAPGQFVVAGQGVARLVASDSMDLTVPLSASEFAMVDVTDSKVKVFSPEGGAPFSGRIVRRLADVDAGGRMARFLVRVSDPYRDGDSLLLPNMYARVLFSGRKVAGSLSIPARALVDGETVYVMTKEMKLAIRKVAPVHTFGHGLVVTGELKPGEEVVVSAITGAAPGMTLRRWEGEGS